MILYKKAQDGAYMTKDSLTPKEFTLAPQKQPPLAFKLPEEKKADNPEYAAMSKVVNQRNSKLPWVKRVFDGNKLLIDNKDGTSSSHLLSVSTGDQGDSYVYPLIVEKEGKLVKLSPDAAWGHAMVNKTAIRFDDKRFADYYAKNGLIKH